MWVAFRTKQIVDGNYENSNFVDEYVVVETENEAREFLERMQCCDNTYCAGYGKIIDATDGHWID